MEHFDICQFISKLRSIQTMLKLEITKWQHTNNSKTVKKILYYDNSIEILICIVDTKNITGLLHVFKERNITQNGLRACFRGGQNPSYRRSVVDKIYNAVVKEMISFQTIK
jgi:hypothetical protein